MHFYNLKRTYILLTGFHNLFSNTNCLLVLLLSKFFLFHYHFLIMKNQLYHFQLKFPALFQYLYYENKHPLYFLKSNEFFLRSPADYLPKIIDLNYRYESCFLYNLIMTKFHHSA